MFIKIIFNFFFFIIFKNNEAGIIAETKAIPSELIMNSLKLSFQNNLIGSIKYRAGKKNNKKLKTIKIIITNNIR